MDINDFIVNNNINKVNNFINSNEKYKTYKIVYHITSSNNATQILKNGFDVKKATTMAFGRGINLSDDKKQLGHYYNKNNNNTIILCLIRYNNLKYNESNPNNKEYYKNMDIQNQIL